MNQEPFRFSLKIHDTLAYAVFVSCFEPNNQESQQTCFEQLVTNLDVESFQRGEDPSHRAAITTVPYKVFPDYQKLFEHNQYTPTDVTEVAFKAYSIEPVDVVKPFYGKIIFTEDRKVYFQAMDAVPVEERKYTTLDGKVIQEGVPPQANNEEDVQEEPTPSIEEQPYLEPDLILR